MRLGLLSTANINRQILGGAAEDGSRRRRRRRQPRRRERRPTPLSTAFHGRTARTRRCSRTPKVDAVYISLPNGMHHDWTSMHSQPASASSARIPSRRPAEAEAAFDAADAAGDRAMEAFMYRHHPQTHSPSLVSSVTGPYGGVVAVKATFSFALGDLTNVSALPSSTAGR